MGGFGFIDVPDDLDHDFDDNDVPNEASDESTARVSRPQLDEWVNDTTASTCLRNAVYLQVDVRCSVKTSVTWVIFKMI